MSLASAAVAFQRPGGEKCTPSKSRPVDLVHLARQTMGDRALEQEVLRLFQTQLHAIRDRLANASAAERRQLAHGLKGSARSIGAFAVAECAEEIERDPDGAAPMRKLADEADRVRQFIAAISR